MTGMDGEVANIDFATEMAQQLMAKVFGTTQGLSSMEETEALEILAAPDAHKPKSPITPARLKAYPEFRESRGGAPKHVDQQVGKMDRLSDYLKEKGLPLNFDTVDGRLKS